MHSRLTESVKVRRADSDFGARSIRRQDYSAGYAVIVIFVAVVIIIALIIALVYLVVLPSTRVTVTGVDWEIHYNGAENGYFGPSPQSSCSACPIKISTDDQFTYTLAFTSSGSSLSHAIDNFTVAAPFTLVSVSPNLPITVTPGGSATITVTLKAPSDAGSYVLSGAMNTT